MRGVARFAGVNGMMHRQAAPAILLQLFTSSYQDVQYNGAASQAEFSMNAAGLASGGPTVVSGSGSYTYASGVDLTLYEVVVTMTGGTTFSGGSGTGTKALGGATLSWRCSRSSPGTKTATATFQIQLAANPGVWLAEATKTLQAITNSGEEP